MNYVPTKEQENSKEAEEETERKTNEQVMELRFYKKLDKFYQVCYKLFQEDFQKITSQFVGSLDQEENLREILG